MTHVNLSSSDSVNGIERYWTISDVESLKYACASMIALHGRVISWVEIAESVPGRNGKQCR